MSQIRNYVLLAVAILVAAACITVEVVYFRIGMQEYQRNEADLKDELDKQPAWQQYGGKLILGQDVRYLVTKGEAFYRVVTKECPTSFCTFNGILDVTSPEFVDATDQFVCNYVFQGKQVVGLQFIEVGTRGRQAVPDLQTKLSDYESSLDVASIEQRIGVIERKIEELQSSSKPQNSAVPAGAELERYNTLLELSVRYDSLKRQLEEKETEYSDLFEWASMHGWKGGVAD